MASNILNFPNVSPISGDNLTYVVVADDAFPLRESIMKPYSHRDLTKDQKIFNYRLSRARGVVENAFGILANRFRILLTTIMLPVDKVQTITLACLALHNFLITESKHNYLNIEQGFMENREEESSLQNIAHQGGNRSKTSARKIRDLYCNFFNTSGSGKKTV